MFQRSQANLKRPKLQFEREDRGSAAETKKKLFLVMVSNGAEPDQARIPLKSPILVLYPVLQAPADKVQWKLLLVWISPHFGARNHVQKAEEMSEMTTCTTRTSTRNELDSDDVQKSSETVRRKDPLNIGPTSPSFNREYYTQKTLA